MRTPPPRSGAPLDSQGEATRDSLLSAGRSLFARRGFDGASVRAITKEADANLGAITYHFGSKQALYDAVLETGLRPLHARVQAAAHGPHGSALDRILSVVEAYFDHLSEHPELPHLLMQEVAAGKDPPAVVREVLSSIKTTVARLHQEGVADGSVRPGHSALMAVSAVSQPVFLTLVTPLLRTIGGIDLGDPDTRAAVVEHVLTFVRAGLTPRETTA